MELLQDADDMVRLLIRAPDQQIEDHIVNCQLNWTVARLKDHLEEVYPSKPKHVDQKVIFSGHVLTDTMILKDVLVQYYNETDKTFIVHLVCPMAKLPTASSNTINRSSDTTTTRNTPIVNVSSSTPIQPSPIQQYYGQLNNQQMAWMQQAYAHYLTQYMQLMAAQGIQLQSTMPYTQPTNADGVNPINLSHSEENTERPAGPEAVDANQINNNININNNNNNNVNNNNNNVGEDNEAGMNRDWLDIFDMLARVVVLSSIVYFYSSPSRFLIVTFLGFAIYLIQGGFFRGAPPPPVDNNNARNDNNNQGNEQIIPPAAPEADGPAGLRARFQYVQLQEDATNQEPRVTAVNNDNERPGALAFTWTFFSSFFASLIPEQPHVI